MSDRSERLAATVEQQSREMLEFLGGLGEAELRAPCGDPGNETVAHVVAHLSDGYEQVLDWIERTAAGLPPRAAPAHTHRHDDTTSAQLDRLRAGGAAWATLVRGLDDTQLDQVPPAAPGIADGTSTLGHILGLMIDHQTAHLAHIRAAVDAGTRQSA